MPLEFLYDLHTKACLQMTSDGNLCHVGTTKLICETNRWTGSFVMWFLQEGHSEHIMILHLCGDARVSTSSRT